jgi:hypothetical protein
LVTASKKDESTLNYATTRARPTRKLNFSFQASKGVGFGEGWRRFRKSGISGGNQSLWSRPGCDTLPEAVPTETVTVCDVAWRFAVAELFELAK